MTAIDNVRRDLREASYLKYSPTPFAGAVHDFSRPLKSRLESRKHVGPYYINPSKPGGSRGFYTASKGLACASHGALFDLRLEDANDHLGESRLRFTTGYYCDEFQDSTLQPIVARLPRGRGFLAGWTMGRGMCATLELDVYAAAEDAARAAHSAAEYAAEQEREYQERESERIEAEEQAARDAEDLHDHD